tara:strand:- start:1148 stop:1864 length:717 start_codon:yes stop_codon:yes gene_type:complete
MKKNKNNLIIIVVAALLIIVAVTFFIVNNKIKIDEEGKNNSTVEKVNTNNIILDKNNKFIGIMDDDHILGKKDAPVKVIEYASLSCPHCAEFYMSGFSNLKSYIDRGQVAFVYRDFPLNGPALAGAVAAKCYYNKVKQSYKYHDFIKTLFKNQEKWAFSPKFISKLAEISAIYGLSRKELNICIDNKDLKQSVVIKAKESSESINIKSTPTFIINGEVVDGYSGWSVLEEVINRKLSK